MLTYTQVQIKPRILKSWTGLSKSEFDALLPSFQSAWDDYWDDYITSSSTSLTTVAMAEAANLI